MIYFLGCPHLGHRNIAKFRPWVKSTEHNTEIFLAQWKKTINKRDIVYFLGDVAFNVESIDLLKPLPGRKILIKGNHDDIVSTASQMEVFEEIHGLLKYKGYWLSHAPIIPSEIRNRKGNIHAHNHTKSVMTRTWYGKKVLDKRYYNTCVDVSYPTTGSIFTTLDQVKAYFGS